MQEPITIEKIKAMQYPTRQDMRDAIWWLIKQLENKDEQSGSLQPVVGRQEMREAFANYYGSEGCMCCEGSNHGKHEETIAKLLEIEKYEDESGYNFRKYSSDR